MARKKKTAHRCRVETSVLSEELEYSRAFGPGQIVDLNETIGTDKKGKAITLGDIVRADCFEEVDAAELEAQADELEAEMETETEKPRGNK